MSHLTSSPIKNECMKKSCNTFNKDTLNNKNVSDFTQSNHFYYTKQQEESKKELITDGKNFIIGAVKEYTVQKMSKEKTNPIKIAKSGSQQVMTG